MLKLYNDIQELFEGARSLSFFLIQDENFRHRDAESTDTYSCGEVFILKDGKHLINISGTEHYFSDIRDEAFGLKVGSGWIKFNISGKRGPRIEFGESYYEKPDFSNLWRYSSLDDFEIKVDLELLKEELSDPYSKNIESVEVIKAIIFKSPTKVVFIGQGSMPYDLIVTTDKRKMQWFLKLL